MGLNLDLRIGTSRAWELQVLNPDGSVPTGQFLSTDTLTAAVWQGSALAPLISRVMPDIAWISATNAQLVINFYPADTANLSPGVYYVEAQAARGTNTADLLPQGTTLTLLATPGTATARPVYVTVADIRRVASWIDDVQGVLQETGFLDQCADARSWLDENILRNYGGGYVSLLGEHGRALYGWAAGRTGNSPLRNPWILQLLQQGPAVANRNGGLILTDRAKDINAFYAAYRICEGMLTRGGQFPALSARMRMQAYQLLAGYTAELSVAGAVDQWGNVLAQVPVSFSAARTLRG
jgi:hypothetical protein